MTLYRMEAKRLSEQAAAGRRLPGHSKPRAVTPSEIRDRMRAENERMGLV